MKGKTMPTVYQTTDLGEAQVRATLVGQGNTDTPVHHMRRGLAHGDALWYVTRDRQEADVVVCITSQGMAQLRICFVDSDGEAGWQKPKPRHVRL
jgi:hypothetical protein